MFSGIFLEVFGVKCVHGLLDGDRLGEISGTIDVAAAEYGDVI